MSLFEWDLSGPIEVSDSLIVKRGGYYRRCQGI